MKIQLITPISLILASTAFAVENINQDSIIFKDGGNLYGEFKGFTADGNINWSRKGAKNEQKYESGSISQLTINGGRPGENAPHTGYLSLVNGDKLPGEIVSIEGESIQLKTAYSGIVTIKKSAVRSFFPNPDGKAYLINGFGKNQKWETITYKYYASGTNSSNATRKDKWELHGPAFYSDPKKAGALVNKALNLPNDFVCKFRYAYQGKRSLDLAIHADLATPKVLKQKENTEKAKEKVIEAAENEIRPREGNAVRPPAGNAAQPPAQNAFRANVNSGIANTFGNCIHLQIGSYHQLSTSGVDAVTNQVFTRRLTSSVPRLYSPLTQQYVDVELQVSRTKRQIILRLDGKVSGEWNLAKDDYLSKGSKLAFFSQSSSNVGSMRVSNLSVTEWHGGSDPPLSLVNESKDMLLLTNETDRFAGSLEKIKEGKLYFKSPFFDLAIPQNKVKQVNFSTKSLTELEPQKNAFAFNFYQSASISGQVLPTSTASVIKVKTSYADEISIPFNKLRSIQLEEVSDLIESWSQKH